MNLGLSEVAFMGNDEPDLPCLEAVGLPVCPADAEPSVRLYCDRNITQKAGGYGAVREFCDWLVAQCN